MDENYNDYLYEISSDLSITLLNNCYYDDEIPEPRIDIIKKSKSISFDFGWHIFEFEVSSTFYLALAVRRNSIGIFCYENDEELPFSMTGNDEIFVGSFNVLVDSLSIVMLDDDQNCFGLSNGKFRFPLAKSVVEYYTSPGDTTLDESYRLRLLFNNNKDKGGILIQKGPIGFGKNILTPLLNQIDLINPLKTESLLIQKKFDHFTDDVESSQQEKRTYNNDSLVNEYSKSSINDILKKYEDETKNKEKFYRFKDFLERLYYEGVFFIKGSALLLFSLFILQVLIFSISIFLQFFNINLS
ncbi:MAG: hypothetical protein ACW981_14120 [Candidatus Hodarchaeales archaeon]